MTRTEAKAATRERMIGAASRSLRRHGIAGTGVAAVMAEAGMTHGGFYAHFPSKDALTAAAITASFGDSRIRLMSRSGDMAPVDALGDWIETYLSPRHRERPERGCALPVLSAEAARGDVATRAALAGGLAELGAWVRGRLEALDRPEPGATANSMVAEAVGALMLSRVLGATPESDALLAGARASLRTRAGIDA